MKARKMLISIVSVGLVLGMMTGCGGGGSDGGDSGGGTPVPPAAGLDNAKVNQTATQLAVTLGCDYTAATAAQSKNLNVPLSYTYKAGQAMKTVIAEDAVLNRIAEISNSAKEESKTYPGSCGGTADTVTNMTSETDGTIDVTFNNYCDDKTLEAKTILNGSAHIEISKSSETAMKITASTPIPISIKTTNPNTKENMDATIDLQGVQLDLVMGVSGDISSLTSLHATAVSAKLTNNIVGESCTATNVDATINMATQTTILTATVNCTGTDTGSVDVSGKVDANGQGTITVTDANGKEGTLTSTSTEGVFNVNFDGVQLGTMDCSMVDVPEV